MNAQASGSCHLANDSPRCSRSSLGRRRGALAEDDGGQRALLPLLVGDADDRRLDDVGVAHQGVLEVDRGDPLAAGLDDVLGPVGERDVAQRVEGADVAGAQPAVVELLGHLAGRRGRSSWRSPTARAPRARRPTRRPRGGRSRRRRRSGPPRRTAAGPGCRGRPTRRRPRRRSGPGRPRRPATSRSCPTPGGCRARAAPGAPAAATPVRPTRRTGSAAGSRASRRGARRGRRTSFHTVGTAPETVGRLAWMNRTSGSACSQRSGMHSDAPVISAAYARPQALAWNIGTIGRTRSWKSTPRRCRC